MSTAVSPGASLDPDVQNALRRLILTLADSKRILGIRYSDWLLGAPSIETAIAASAMSQDEWGHARLLYAMLKDFGIDPVPVEHERARGEYASVDALDRPFQDWAGFVAASVIVDGALSVALEGFSRGGYELARSRIPKMLAEEEFHWDMGKAWFHRLSEGSDEGRERLAAAAERFLPRTLAWVAPADESHALLARLGFTEAAPALRTRFDERCGAVLGRLGIEAAAVPARREGWDSTRGRGTGGPDDEAVARARGDLNRALFVE